ncbi:MAG TPA: hypothetical protein PLT74_11180, partial [Kiritimatiellia bacterium]|nr:hypothetical protein [Kiritimatiellia bacterium]
ARPPAGSQAVPQADQHRTTVAQARRHKGRRCANTQNYYPDQHASLLQLDRSPSKTPKDFRPLYHNPMFGKSKSRPTRTTLINALHGARTVRYNGGNE